MMKTKTFSAVWTIDKIVDLEAEHGEEMMDILSKEIQKEIDDSIMIDLYTTDGWIKVELKRFNDRYHAIDIQIWCDENIAEHEYASFGSTFVFKNSADAEWFTLKWVT
jgi:hypothetical protein